MLELWLLQWLPLYCECAGYMLFKGDRYTVYPWQAQCFLFMPRPYKHIKQKLSLLGLRAVGQQGDIRESSGDF